MLLANKLGLLRASRGSALVMRASSSGKHSTAARAAAEAKWAADTSTRSARTECGVFIISHFDSGNIVVESATNPEDIRLSLHSDPYCDVDQRAHAQWYNFRLTGARSKQVTMHIVNAGKASYPMAWQGYQSAASYDLQHWFRVPTSYDADSGVLTIRHTPERDAVQYAYFAPYPLERHVQLVARMQAKKGVRLLMIGETTDGHDLDLLQVGEPGPGKRVVWIIARQHPGESQAEWLAEGLLERLTDRHDAVARTLLRDAVFYVMPCMCPDGVWRGHLRTNANGVNLNRAWAAPDEEEAAEVFHLLRKMDELGCDLFIDVHGDEELPACFFAGAEGIPNWTDRLQQLQAGLAAAFMRASPDFQTKVGYSVDAPGQANLMIASNAVAQRFDCCSVTLEMPFKDNAALADPAQGWSPERSMRLGAALLTAINEVLPRLR